MRETQEQEGKRIMEVIRAHPGAKLEIDNDCWHLLNPDPLPEPEPGAGTEEWREWDASLMLLSDTAPPHNVRHYSNPGDLLDLFAAELGLTPEPV